MALIWAFRPLAKLKNQVGFVDVPDLLKKQLIASGDAQESNRGALFLNEIDYNYKPAKVTKPAVDPTPAPATPVEPAAAV